MKINDIAQWVLTRNCQVVPRREICHLTNAELAPSNETELRKLTEFDTAVPNRLGKSFTLPPTTASDIVCARGNEANPQGGDFDPYLDDEETP